MTPRQAGTSVGPFRGGRGPGEIALRRRALMRPAALAVSVLLATLSAGAAAHGGPTRPTGPPVARLEILARLPTSAIAVAVDGDRALVATDAGFTVGDLTDPDGPRAAGRVDLAGGWSGAVAVAGRRGYGVVAPDQLWVLDLADADAPRLAARLTLGAPILSVTAAGDLALVALGSRGLAVVDGAAPAGPRVVGRLGTRWLTRHAVSAGRYAYLAERDAFESLVRVVDLADSATPVEVAVVDVPGGAERLALSGDTLLVMGPTNALALLDVAPRGSPPRIRTFGVLPCDRLRGVATAGPAAFLACDRGLTPSLVVLNLTAGEPLTPSTSLGLPSIPLDLAAMDGSLLVAAGVSGARYYQLRQPLAPVAVDWSMTAAGGTTDLGLAADYLYTVGNDRLTSIDARQAGAPVPVRADVLGGDLWDLAVRPDRPEILVAGRPVTTLDCPGAVCTEEPSGPGLQRVHIGQPAAPAALGLEGDIVAAAVAVEGDVLATVVERSYAKTGPAYGWNSGLGAFALAGVGSAPRAQSLDRFVPATVLYGTPAEVVLRRGYAYVAGSATGLHVFDARDPDRVRHLAALTEHGLAEGHTVAVAGDLLVAGTPRGLVVLDLSLPGQPATVAEAPVAGGVDHLAADGEHVLTLTAGRRAQLYHLDPLGALTLMDDLALAPADLPPPMGRRCWHNRDCLPGPGAARLTLAGRRAFARVPGAGLFELAIVAGARPTPPTPAPPDTPVPTRTIAVTPVVSPTAPASPEPTATPAPTRAAPPRDRLYLPLLSSGA